MPFDLVNTLFEDARGELWVGSREGLIRLTGKLFAVVTKRQWLTHNHVTSVLEDHQKRLWVGTWGGGLDQLSGDKVRVYGTTNLLASDYIKALCEGHDGSVWVGTDNDAGLFQITGQGVTHFGTSDGMVDATISALHEDRQSNLWIGTRRGLCRLSHGVFVTETNADDRPLWVMCEDAAGQMWFGGDAGLIRWRNGRVENLSDNGSFPPEAVSALCADADDDLWVGTRTGGLLRWHGGGWQRFGTQDGLYSNEVLGIAEDHGWLWMTSTKGIFRVRRQDLEALVPGRKEAAPCIVYGKSDGLETIVCDNWSSPTVCKTADDRLCFATTIGLAIMDARQSEGDLSPPPVYIEQLQVDRKTIPLSGPMRTLPPSHGELDIRYCAPDLRAPEKCRFKYRLDGVDPGWIDADTHRTAHYSDVGPGTYRFCVLACNKDGVWNETGASLGLELWPHYWQTWWFRSLVVAALIGAVGGVVRLILWQKMRQKLALLEMQHSLERERARISRDIHDDLGATLTQITLLSELAQREANQPPKVGHGRNRLGRQPAQRPLADGHGVCFSTC
jgi:hypothetical protein